MRLHYFLTLIVVVARLVVGQEIDSTQIRKKLTGLLFGPIWDQSQFCGLDRTIERLQQDDDITEKIINGSSLREVVHSAGSSFNEGMHKLMFNFIVMKNSMSLVCSSNSWSYADMHSRDLSNQQSEDADTCKCRLESLLQFTSNAISNNVSSGSGYSSNSDNCPSGNKNDYLVQLTSFGRVTSGQMYFNDLWLGDYDSCSKLRSARYCFGSYKSFDWADYEARKGDYRGFRIGLCLPRACGLRTLKDNKVLRKIDYVVKSNLIDLFGLTNPEEFALDDIYCPPTSDSQWMSFTKDYTSIVLLSVIVIWMILLIYASSSDNQESSIVRGFDLGRQITGFFRYNQSKSDLYGINALKVLAAIWLVCAHTFMVSIPYLKNATEIKTHNLGGLLLIQGQHAVPIFFMISGLLAGLKHLNKSQDVLRMIVYRYLRLAPMYLVVYVYIKKFGHIIGSGPLWDYGVSPESEARQCMLESWFVPILMLANFVNPFSHCILTGWHIASDFQIYLILPILFYTYKKSRYLGRLTVKLGFLASHIYHIWNFNETNLFDNRQFIEAPFFYGPRLVMDKLATVYTSPIGRFGTYFLGVLLADMLLESRARSENNKTSHIPVEARTILANQSTSLKSQHISYSEDADRDPYVSSKSWLDKNRSLIIGILFWATTITSPTAEDFLKKPLYQYKGYTYPVLRMLVELAYFAILYHLLDLSSSGHGSSSYSIVERVDKDQSSAKQSAKIFRSNTVPDSMEVLKKSFDGFKNVQQPGNWFGRLLGSKFWDITVKLNYTVILLHYTVARYIVQSQRDLATFNSFSFLGTLSQIIATSYLLGFIVHITVEMPLTNLVKILVSKIDRRNH